MTDATTAHRMRLSSPSGPRPPAASPGARSACALYAYTVRAAEKLRSAILQCLLLRSGRCLFLQGFCCSGRVKAMHGFLGCVLLASSSSCMQQTKQSLVPGMFCWEHILVEAVTQAPISAHANRCTSSMNRAAAVASSAPLLNLS
jgi:hypothetical protein